MMVFLPLTTSLVSKKSAVLRQTSGSCGKSAIVIVFIKEESKRLAMRNFEPRSEPKKQFVGREATVQKINGMYTGNSTGNCTIVYIVHKIAVKLKN